MAWLPSLYSVSGPIIERNVLAYIAANQTQALAWAKAQLGFVGTVADFQNIYNSSEGRIHLLFPDLMLIRRSTSFRDAGDDISVLVQHTLGFEMEIAHADADTLTNLVNVYGVALMSMLWNIPRASLVANVPTQGQPVVNVTDFDRDQTRGTAGSHLQTPHVIATVELLEVKPNA